MQDDESIRTRVEEFIQDSADWNAKFYQPGHLELLDWEAAREALASVAVKHFVSKDPQVRAIGWPPEHAPDQETIISVMKQPDDQVLVETESKRSGLPHYYEYTLRKVRGDWRIVNVLHGQVIFNSEGCGRSICGRETTHYLPVDFRQKQAVELEVQIYLGHRYEIISGS